jgi:serine/threonine protein phosphatase PrpC
MAKPSSWKKVLTRVISLDSYIDKPFMYVLATDGWGNSHASELDFHKTCTEYFEMIQEHGAETVKRNLPTWLSETSKMGCGDDITVVCVYFE